MLERGGRRCRRRAGAQLVFAEREKEGYGGAHTPERYRDCCSSTVL